MTAFPGPVFGPVVASKWDRAKVLDAAIEEPVRSGHIIGRTVTAAKDGAIVCQRTAGCADRESRWPMVEDDKFSRSVVP